MEVSKLELKYRIKASTTLSMKEKTQSLSQSTLVCNRPKSLLTVTRKKTKELSRLSTS
jgi:hypothetical protein